MKNETEVRGRAVDAALTDPGVEVKTIVKPVQNAIAILRHLAEVGEPCTATQISRVLRINTSTCFNILRTLAGEGITTFDPTAKTYKIGIGILRLVSDFISEESRLASARQSAQRFATLYGATICIWRRMSADRNILVAAEHNQGDVRIHLQMGQSLPVLLGSTGRVMATRLGLTKAQVRAEFKKLRWFNAPSFEEFWHDAQMAEKRGWAVDRGNFSAGVLTVSTPVINDTGHIAYSLTALTFRDQHHGESVEALGEGLVDLARELSRVLY